MRLLLVEDNSATAEALAAILGLEGHAVRLAADGFEVRAASGSTRRSEAIVLDFYMPQLDGLSFLRAARKLPGCASAAVIVTTAASDEGIAAIQAETEELGICAILRKPFVPEDLLKALEELPERNLKEVGR